MQLNYINKYSNLGETSRNYNANYNKTGNLFQQNNVEIKSSG